jgi:hypothetical protein
MLELRKILHIRTIDAAGADRNSRASRFGDLTTSRFPSAASLVRKRTDSTIAAAGRISIISLVRDNQNRRPTGVSELTERGGSHPWNPCSTHLASALLPSSCSALWASGKKS